MNRGGKRNLMVPIRVVLFLVFGVAVAGAALPGSSAGASSGSTGYAAKGGQAATTRVKGSNGVPVNLRLSYLGGCHEVFLATFDRPRLAQRSNDIGGSFTLKAPPSQVLSLVTYEPNSGLLVAYAKPSVTRIRWLAANERTTIDTLRPWRGWVAEAGPVVGRSTRPSGSGTGTDDVGTLEAFSRAGKKLGRVTIAVANDTDKPTASFSC